MLAHLALAGDSMGVAAELEQAGSLDATWGLEIRALFATLPVRACADAELERVRDELARVGPARCRPSMFLMFAMHNGLHPAIRDYLLGMLELRLGERAPRRAGGRSWTRWAEASRTAGAELGGRARARIAQVEGRQKGALTLLERVAAGAVVSAHGRLALLLAGVARLSAGGAVAGGGRPEEAAGWYRSMAQRSPYELMYRGPGAERLAEMAAGRGRGRVGGRGTEASEGARSPRSVDDVTSTTFSTLA